MHHTIVTLVEDKPGVLNRVASLFRRRNFNIDSLTVGRTETKGVSRMTIVVDNEEVDVKRLTSYLYKLVNVLEVFDLSAEPNVSRDLVLVKVKAPPESRAQILQLVEVFRARTVDMGANSIIIEITGTEDKIEGFVDVLRPWGIIEMVRTGIVSMARGCEMRVGNGNGKVSAQSAFSMSNNTVS
ncbi:MAG: acetolactate synthase small subunit [Chloroflexi bacterium 44-23]|nr:MAG: acetolactate synthase small subunit [Chloroflexi bacterium 44-23]